MSLPNSQPPQLTVFQRLVNPFREFGLFTGAVYALDRVLQECSPRLGVNIHDWMVQPITDKRLIPERFSQSYKIREIKKGDPEIDDMPIRPDILESRFEQNAICLGASRKRELIGYIWLSFDTYEEDDARCTFVLSPSEQSVFDFDLRIYPAHRQGIGFAVLWDGVNRYLYERGVRYSYSRLTRFNQASASAHNHLGWKRIGSALIFQLLGVELILATRHPWVFVSLRQSARVPIHLSPEVLSAPT